MIKVTDIKKVNATRYKEGQLFIEKRSRLFILMNGEFKELFFDKPMTRKQVENIVKKEIEKGLSVNE